ncbi:dioxygenase [Actinophytocola xinjiangensis]|nr:dioxygenase [Actinophytocola xinjiangensis]
MTSQRVATFAAELIAHLRDSLVRHGITYGEYHDLKEFVVELGDAAEWHLLLDILFESTVETHNGAGPGASAGAVEGPFHVPDAPLLYSPCALPQQDDEPGERLRLTGRVRSADGGPLPGAVLDTWQADMAGGYSHFVPALPEHNLRARVVADDEGRYDIATVVPGAYQVPSAGPSGRLFALLGMHAWRPAHVHFKISAPGHRTLTTQLYFAGDPWLDSDVAGGVKDELVLRPAPGEHTLEAGHDFVLARAQD